MGKFVSICFLGMDGSGKSTLSKYLYQEFKTRNYNVKYIWWLEGENSLLRKLLRGIGKSKYSKLENNIDNSNKKIKDQSITVKIFRDIYSKIVLLDYLRFGIVKVWFPKIMNNNQIIIFDRFVYDVILAISKEFGLSALNRARLFKIYSKLLPNPDLIFIIDVPAEVSYLRKKEEIKSLGNAKAIWDDHQQLYSLLDNLTSGRVIRIDNKREISIVKSEILKTALEFI